MKIHLAKLFGQVLIGRIFCPRTIFSIKEGSDFTYPLGQGKWGVKFSCPGQSDNVPPRVRMM